MSGSHVSLVFLRRAPRKLTKAQVTETIQRVLEVNDVTVETLPADPQMPGRAYATIPDDLPPLMVFDMEAPYMDREDRIETAKRVKGEAAQTAVLTHKAWMAVDAIGSEDLEGEQRLHAYALLHALAEELLDDDSMLLYLPGEERYGPPGRLGLDWLMHSLRVGHFDTPIEGFEAPITRIEVSDEEMDECIAQARERLPEFCAAWDRLGPESSAMIKARFSTADPSDPEGAEFVWVLMTSLDDDGIIGTMESAPASPAIPKQGSTVRVKIDDVADWAYKDEDGNAHGLFTDELVRKRAAERKDTSR
jgi:uncharacterized protein YegJ (DUF2314 family)